MKPCKKYGHTEGRTKNRSCVVCDRAHKQTPQYRAKEALRQARYATTVKGILARIKCDINSNASRRGNQ